MTDPNLTERERLRQVGWQLQAENRRLHEENQQLRELAYTPEEQGVPHTWKGKALRLEEENRQLREALDALHKTVMEDLR